MELFNAFDQLDHPKATRDDETQTDPDEERAKLKAENDQLEPLRERLKQERDLREAADGEINRLRPEQARAVTMQKQIAELQGQLATAEREKGELRAAANRRGSRQPLIEAQTEITRLSNQINHPVDGITALQAQIANRDVQINHPVNGLVALQNARDLLRGQVDALTPQITALQGQNGTLTLQRDGLQGQVREVEARKQGEVDNLRGQIAAKDAQIAALSAAASQNPQAGPWLRAHMKNGAQAPTHR